MKKIQKLLLLLLMMSMLLPTFAMAETPVIVNLVEDPDAEYHFEDGAKILEIVFPRVYSSDCILLRYDGMVMMIDASTKNATMRNRIYTACDTLGIDHIDIAYNSHPHDDHIDGFQFVNEYAPISKFLITFPEDFNARMKSAVKFMKANNIPIEQIGNGDTFTLGEDGGVKMTVIQYHKSSWGVNDQSAMLDGAVRRPPDALRGRQREPFAAVFRGESAGNRAERGYLQVPAPRAGAPAR